MDQKIDFVLIWVDGSDHKWQENKQKYSLATTEDDGKHRYRDWDLLKYWFRGVEKYAPWVNNVFFITCGHYPSWLDLKHPKLKFVKHSDYIPEEYLPTFSSHPIELNLHRIKELSEHFVYFNDDTFIINKVDPKDFFVNSLPRDGATMNLIKIESDYFFHHFLANNIFLINEKFSKKEVIKQNYSKWFNIRYGIKNNLRNLLFYFLGGDNFTGFRNEHLPVPFLKRTLESAWENYNYYLDATSKRKFRDIGDVSQYLFRYLQFVEGRFCPTNVSKLGLKISMPKNEIKLKKHLEGSQYKMICVNDDSAEMNFDLVKSNVIKMFKNKLPKKSSFEM